MSLCLFVVISSGCFNRSQKNKGTTDLQQPPKDIYEYFVVPVGPDNPRNSESDIIQLTDGSLLLGWTEFFAANGSDEGAARICGKISTDGGRTWSEKYTLVENDGGLNVMEVNFLRLENGQIALFYCRKMAFDVKTRQGDCRIMMRTSSDEGKTWGNPKQLSPSGRYIGLTNGRSIRLRSGRILLEAWENTGYCYCLLSDDEGKTWHYSQHVKPELGHATENTCVELKNGKVLMLIRTELGGQFKSISSDGGETWSEPEPTPLLGSAAPAAITRIPDSGDLLVIWTNNVKHNDENVPGYGKRNPLTSAISKDEGKTWENFRNLEEVSDDAWAYPAITWVENRALITYFNYKGGLSLKLKSLPSGWFYQ